MDRELQNYYENRFDLCASVGWKELLEDIETMIKDYSNLGNIQSFEQMMFRKGQLDILNWLRNLKQVSEYAYDELQKEV